MNQEQNRSPNWGCARENAGRKSIWNHKETCTIRITTGFAPKLHEIAQKWDKDPQLNLRLIQYLLKMNLLLIPVNSNLKMEQNQINQQLIL